MSSPNGVVNGTKCLLVKQLTNDQQLFIGALVSNNSAFTRALIDATNKSSNGYREYLIGEGTKSAEHSCECYFSSDEAFQEMRDAWKTGEIGRYFFVLDNKQTDIFDFKVESFSDSVNLNEAVKTSFSLKSSDEYTLEVLFHLLLTNDDASLSVNNDDELAAKV